MSNKIRALSGASLLGLAALAGVAWGGEAPISVRVQNRAVPAGGSYFQPMNSKGNKIPLYSYDKSRYTIDNTSDAPVTIEGITVEAAGEDGKPWEWSILDPRDFKNPVMVVSGEVIAPKGTFDFIVQFFPVRGDLRTATVTITYDGGQTYVFTAEGKGRPVDTMFLQEATSVWETCLGGDQTDELVTGLAADEAGNLYVSGNVAQVVHKFNHDVFLASVDPEGQLRWAKAWAGKNQDYQRDPGQNAESGGSAQAIAYDDGHVYLAISHSPSGSNSTFFSVVVKVVAETGEIAWQQAWGPTAGVELAKESSEAYALDVHGDHVFVTGVVEGNAKVLLLVLDKASGAVVQQKAIEVAAGTNDRGYAVKADGKGGVYLAGLTNGRGLLLHVGSAASDPKLTWVRKISMGVGSNVNAVDVDAEGNAYLSCDRRGANTKFSFMRVNADGNVAWAKTYNAKDNGQKNNTHAVKVVGDRLYVAGKGGIPWHDGQFGDALLVRVAIADGALDWGGFYFGGKGAEEMAEHRLKGIAIAPDGHLLLAGQVYTNPNDHFHFWGHWYRCKDAYEDYKQYTPTDETEKSSLSDVPAAFGVKDASTLPSFHGWVDLTGGEPLAKDCHVMTYQPLRENEGSGPDGEAFFMKLKLN